MTSFSIPFYVREEYIDEDNNQTDNTDVSFTYIIEEEESNSIEKETPKATLNHETIEDSSILMNLSNPIEKNSPSNLMSTLKIVKVINDDYIESGCFFFLFIRKKKINQLIPSIWIFYHSTNCRLNSNNNSNQRLPVHI